ncbi:MAG TPA: NUDIX domain-containing protein [Rubrivivax sp.]|nr:NUDIX domain-containing protein [Rubrivivax sp.]
MKAVENDLWLRAEALLPDDAQGDGMTAYTQGLMDLGATLCTRGRPSCLRCPLAQRCAALAQGRVHELPVRKPKKAVPVKTAVMLALIDQGCVLLEKRPATGIWGGLYSLPELDGHRPLDAQAMEAEPAAIEAACAPFGAFASSERLPGFVHGFTHFTLEVAPYRVTLSTRAALAGEDRYLWQPLDAIAGCALPAPVKKFLVRLADEAPRLF